MALNVNLERLLHFEGEISFRQGDVYTTIRDPNVQSLTPDEWRVAEYDLARTALIYLCGEGRHIDPSMLTPTAQLMVEDMGGLARFYETQHPDVVETWQSLARLRTEQNIVLHHLHLFDHNKPKKIFTI